MHNYTVVSFFKHEKEKTKFPSDNWPLHLTIADDFRVEINDHLLKGMAGLAAAQPAFYIVAENDVFFGANENILVTLIKNNAELLNLHNSLNEVLMKCGAVFGNPHFHRSGFRPHVTVGPNGRLSLGERVKIDEVSIVDLEPSHDIEQRKVVANFKLTS